MSEIRNSKFEKRNWVPLRLRVAAHAYLRRFSWELAEEADVILKKNLDVVDLVFEHG